MNCTHLICVWYNFSMALLGTCTEVIPKKVRRDMAGVETTFIGVLKLPYF